MAKEVSPETMTKMVDTLLEYKGVSRDELFEYPYTDTESRDRLAHAEATARRLLRMVED